MKAAPEYAEAAETSLKAAEAIRHPRGDSSDPIRFSDRQLAEIEHHHRRAAVFATLALAAATHRPVAR